jgi:hypothetical protein
LAIKIGAILKVSVAASVLLASSSVGYYYLVYLPHRDAEAERVLERLRAAEKKHVEQGQSLFERQASEQRAAEQKATEERLALEKANSYQACLSRATDKCNASRLATCNRPREKIIKDRDDCIKLGFSEKVCAMAHVAPESSPNCTLPRAVALPLDAEVKKERDRCREEESTAGSSSPTEPASQPGAASPSAPVDEVKAYLWSVYQRSPTKVDGHGDFTWKDVSAAGRSGLSVKDYVIGGLDPDFRELLFAAGHAMDAAGIGWRIPCQWRDGMSWRRCCGTSGSRFLPKLIRRPSVTSLLSSNTCAFAPFSPILPPREPRWRKLRAMEPQAGSPVRPYGMKQVPTGMVLLKSQRVFASSRRSGLGPHPTVLAAISLKTTRPPRSIDWTRPASNFWNWGCAPRWNDIKFRVGRERPQVIQDSLQGDVAPRRRPKLRERDIDGPQAPGRARHRRRGSASRTRRAWYRPAQPLEYQILEQAGRLLAPAEGVRKFFGSRVGRI